jgi:hypothetical protein
MPAGAQMAEALRRAEAQRDALLTVAQESRDIIINALAMLAQLEQVAPEDMAQGIREFWLLLEQRGYSEIGTRLDRAIALATSQDDAERPKKV